MQSEPVSVIMPIKGGGTFLRSALASVARQTVPVMELLVIDDGMDPSAHTIIAASAPTAAKTIVLPGPRSGPASARNCGLRAAHGALIAFLDDDDVWPDDKLQRQCRYLADHPDVLAVGGRIYWFHDWDETGRPCPSAGDRSIIHVNLGAILVRRAAFGHLGLFDEKFLYSEDVDFVLRMVDSGWPFALIDDNMLYYRRHAHSMTALGDEREMIDFRRALFSSLRRRKGKRARKLEEFLVSDQLQKP
jgi:glycosyltransferase involved in cell wall biosynthesis